MLGYCFGLVTRESAFGLWGIICVFYLGASTFYVPNVEILFYDAGAWDTGLKDILADLPRREASKFRSQVSTVLTCGMRLYCFLIS